MARDDHKQGSAQIEAGMMIHSLLGVGALGASNRRG